MAISVSCEVSDYEKFSQKYRGKWSKKISSITFLFSLEEDQVGFKVLSWC